MSAEHITDGLDVAGAALVSAILVDMKARKLEPDAREAELLRTAGELRDRMTILEAAIVEDGLKRLSNAGTIQLHPAAAELRQHAVALSRVLAGVALFDSSGGKSARHQRAAAARWAGAKENG